VRVGFESIRCEVQITPAPDADPRRVAQVTEVAERCCVVLDTLRSGVPIEVEFDVGTE
jgi:uncharacterized OsmC-like protein